jgi:hypothetical protein
VLRSIARSHTHDEQVFVREALVSEVRQLGAALVKLGYGGYTANKGTSCVRVRAV